MYHLQASEEQVSRIGKRAQELCMMRFGSNAKVLAECKLKYYRISECYDLLQGEIT